MTDEEKVDNILNKFRDHNLRPHIYQRGMGWRCYANKYGNYWEDGSTPLEAAQRCYCSWVDLGMPSDSRPAIPEEADKYEDLIKEIKRLASQASLEEGREVRPEEIIDLVNKAGREILENWRNYIEKNEKDVDNLASD